MFFLLLDFRSILSFHKCKKSVFFLPFNLLKACMLEYISDWNTKTKNYLNKQKYLIRFTSSYLNLNRNGNQFVALSLFYTKV